MNSIIATRIGIRITTRNAPSTNFTVATTISTTNVSTAPTPLSDARHAQPRLRSPSQCRTIPACDSVKHTNTPTE